MAQQLLLKVFKRQTAYGAGVSLLPVVDTPTLPLLIKGYHSGLLSRHCSGIISALW